MTSMIYPTLSTTLSFFLREQQRYVLTTARRLSCNLSLHY
jgi:hypothetical protein